MFPLLGRSRRYVADLESENLRFFNSECKSPKVVTVRRHSILRRSSVAELASTILAIVESNSGWLYSVRGLSCFFLLNGLKNFTYAFLQFQTTFSLSFCFALTPVGKPKKNLVILMARL